jgi:hypothetical protein
MPESMKKFIIFFIKNKHRDILKILAGLIENPNGVSLSEMFENLDILV